jgi:hypothetical protein
VGRKKTIIIILILYLWEDEKEKNSRAWSLFDILSDLDERDDVDDDVLEESAAALLAREFLVVSCSASFCATRR